MLSPTQVEQFRRDGFLVLEGFAAEGDLAALRARADELVRAWEPSTERTVFTTNEQARASNAEFLSSGSKIWCFFEEEAFDEAGELRQAKERSINKLGHAMHDLDPVFERFTYTPELAAVAADIGLADALVLQSMYIFKQPGIGGEVTCHQDATFLYTDPITVTGFWFALEDATLENGCLWAAPGGHRTGLRSVFRRTGAMGDDDGTETVELDPTPLPTVPDNLVPLEVPAGTLVVLDGRLPHYSATNRSPRSRHAYTVHCISASADYPAWNWLRRPADLPLRSLGGVAASAA
ncbi:MAG: phytanoyl-CoA dioxygenase family protein [Actinomycetota bacterium]|nr:phytanoyl-CoA dioxygenase family protein [Actinomycetota bacterium]